MKGPLTRKQTRAGYFRAGFALALWVSSSGGCSTSHVTPLPAVPPTPPDYVQVPHPEGLDYADLLAIFTDLKAPSPDVLKDCDSDYFLLRKMTTSKDEQEQGTRELVRRDPVKYHWCFYSRMMEMEQQMRSQVYLDERQKTVLQTFLFLAPVARAFMKEFQDSRYLRWAITRYQRLSEHVFYRRLEIAPGTSQDLGVLSNPFATVRPTRDNIRGVLEKYGIAKPQDVAPVPTAPTSLVGLLPGPSPVPSPGGEAARAPASTPSAAPSPDPSPAAEASPAPQPQAAASPPPVDGENLDKLLNAQGGAPAQPQPAAAQPIVQETQGAGAAAQANAPAPAQPTGPLPDAVTSNIKAPAAPARAVANAPAPVTNPPVEAVLDGDQVVTPAGSQ